MTKTETSVNAAIAVLEQHVSALTDGMDSISEQRKHVEKIRVDLARAEQRLDDSKAAYVEMTAALERLRA